MQWNSITFKRKKFEVAYVNAVHYLDLYKGYVCATLSLEYGWKAKRIWEPA